MSTEERTVGVRPEEILTEAEIALASKLGECFGDFVGLEQVHPSDIPDFCFHIHALQNILMARAGMRAFPEHFPKRLP